MAAMRIRALDQHPLPPIHAFSYYRKRFGDTSLHRPRMWQARGRFASLSRNVRWASRLGGGAVTKDLDGAGDVGWWLRPPLPTDAP